MPVDQRTGSAVSRRMKHSRVWRNLIVTAALAGSGVIAVVSPNSVGAQSADCSWVPETTGFWIDQWSSDSGWKSLTTDPAIRERVVAIQLKTPTALRAGNIVRIHENWGPSTISVSAPAGPWTDYRVPVSPGSGTTLQLSIDNVVRTGHTIDVRLCVAPITTTPTTLAPTSSPSTVQPTTVQPTTVRPTTPPTVVEPTLPTPTTVPTPTGSVDKTPRKAALPPTSAQSTQYSNLRAGVAFNVANWDRLKSDAAFRLASEKQLAGSWIKAHPTIPTPMCLAEHDLYWTYGPDSKAYHSWHPATVFLSNGDRCDFGHEHGMNPLDSVLIDDFGGLPPFGYVAEQHHFDDATHQNGEHRHEDHVGHKVSLSNNWEAAYGNSASPTPKIYAAGYSCSFISKLHQGSHSDDAFTNHLHEYFITMRCNDGGKVRSQIPGQGSSFSVKMMVPFGNPNQFKDMNLPGPDEQDSVNGGKSIKLSSTAVIGLSGNPLLPTPLVGPVADRFPNAPNNREFTSPNSWLWKDLNATRFTDRGSLTQIDLWSQIINVETPARRGQGDAAGVRFGAYYIVKNPSRYYDHDQKRVLRTVDVCYPGPTKTNYRYCETAPASKIEWNSAASPFNGTIRAVNFKALHLNNQGGNAAFCTDVFGRNPTEAIGTGCANPNHILQRASTVDNLAENGDPGPNARCAPQNPNVCGIAASTLNADVAADGSFTPQGLGFELLIDQRTYTASAGDPPSLYGQKKVIYGEN